MKLQFLTDKSLSDSQASLLETRPRRKWIHWVVYFACAYLFFVPLMVTFLWMNYRIKNERNLTQEWDYLLFTQEYPVTCCIWMKESKAAHSCNLPANQNAWSIHGIWPTLNGTEGPFYCRNLPFNETVLKPILPELKKYWFTVGMHGNSAFWKHEWTKHGTCAVEDPIFDSELTYFKQGLELYEKWNLTSILQNAGIVPSDSKTYSYGDFYNTIKVALGFAPYLDCYHDKDRDISLINEVRHCLTEDLHLIDCDMYPQERNCPETGIYYPATSSFLLSFS